MTFEEIKELIQLVLDTGVAELEVARGDDRVRIRRNAETASREFVVPADAAIVQTSGAPGGYQSGAPAPAQSAAPQAAPEAEQDDSLEYAKSPIVGTFYEAPAPDADPFVRVGDRVTPGQVLCIIESMKLMNEIESEVAGTVIRKLVENGSPIEYGEALYAIRTD